MWSVFCIEYFFLCFGGVDFVIDFYNEGVVDLLILGGGLGWEVMGVSFYIWFFFDVCEWVGIVFWSCWWILRLRYCYIWENCL